MAALKIGHYRLGKTLGMGNFGKVKLAVHEVTGHKVAVKILNRKRIKALDMEAKIRREVQVLKLFLHPHIIRMYETVHTQSDMFLVMEYVSGGELFDYIVSNGRLSENEARRFFQQIISGVEYCHRHMVVHRDLKPENLLLDANNNVKIADFGLSNIMIDGDFMKTSCGSPNYAAPEVISGNLYAGPEVDVWSCGVILYALLCGRLPFDDEYIPNLFKKIKSGVFHLPGYLSDEARDLLCAMMVLDPLRRITIEKIREHPWFRKNLPPYLANPPKSTTKEIKELDDDAITELTHKLGITRDQAMQSLVDPSQTRDQVVVAYHLIVDHRTNMHLAQESPPNVRSVPFGSSLSPDTATKGAGGKLRSHQRQPSTGSSDHGSRYRFPTLPSYNDPEDMGELEAMPGKGGPKAARPADLPEDSSRRRRWYLGFSSTLEPPRVMTEIYRGLAKFGIEWKVVSPYEIRCRFADQQGPVSQLKFGIKLFKIDTVRFVVDVQKLTGAHFLFMDLCAQLSNELRLL